MLRRFVIVVMLLLLPLRAVMGDAMAMEMAMEMAMRMATDITPAHASPCHEVAEMADMDAMHGMDHGASAAGQSATHQADDCHSGLSCQVCHSAAIFLPAHAAPLFPPAQAAPRSPVAGMTEAPTIARFKPPIS